MSSIKCIRSNIDWICHGLYRSKILCNFQFCWYIYSHRRVFIIRNPLFVWAKYTKLVPTRSYFDREKCAWFRSAFLVLEVWLLAFWVVSLHYWLHIYSSDLFRPQTYFLIYYRSSDFLLYLSPLQSLLSLIVSYLQKSTKSDPWCLARWLYSLFFYSYW